MLAPYPVQKNKISERLLKALMHNRKNEKSSLSREDYPRVIYHSYRHFLPH